MPNAAALYPPPPWTMHGYAYFAPYRVRTASLRLPEGFEVAHPGPMTVGMFGFVKYESPSPLVYDELIWMPAFVRAPHFGPRAKGWFVSVMYVSEKHTLAGGRDIWKLPKTLAHFDVRGDGCDVRADDGTSLSVAFSALGPQLNSRGQISTLQVNDGRSLCRFTGSSRARVGAARLQVTDFANADGSWMGFDPAARLPSPAITQRQFVSEMQVPMFVTRTTGS